LPAARAIRKTTAARPQPASAESVAARLEKLGIHGKRDLLLHLPLRYEDETKLTPLSQARAGLPVLVEAEVVESKVEYRGRRTLVVKLNDGERELWVRFLNFYPSQVKQFAEGKRVRLFGEVRPGFFGDEMVHPRYRIVAKGAPLSKSLTPVYPTTAGLAQNALRDMINGALDTLSLDDTLDAKLLAKLKLMAFRDAVLLLHRPPPTRPRSSWTTARIRRGGGSSSTSCSRSSSPCASPIASAARRRRPRSPMRTRSPTRS
jgi:ATP-dependent DNA helicase RecG